MARRGVKFDATAVWGSVATAGNDGKSSGAFSGWRLMYDE